MTPYPVKTRFLCAAHVLDEARGVVDGEKRLAVAHIVVWLVKELLGVADVGQEIVRRARKSHQHAFRNMRVVASFLPSGE